MMSDVHHIIPPPESHVNINHSTKYLHVKEPSTSPSPSSPPSSPPLSLTARDRCPELNRAIQSVRYIAAFTKEEIENGKAKEDWKFVAMVLDRLFLWIFSVAVVVGTAGIILQAPSLYDLRPAIDEYLSEIEVAVAKPHGGEI